MGEQALGLRVEIVREPSSRTALCGEGGPMLCLAVVNFTNGTDPLYLSRYIDFPRTYRRE